MRGGGGGGEGVIGWCDGAGHYFQCRGVLLIWIIVGQGTITLAVGVGWVVWTCFLSSIVSLFFLPLWETSFSLFGRQPDID